MTRPGRPFGVSLAIVASAFLFSVLPLMQIGLFLLVGLRFANRPLTIPYGDSQITSGASGVDILGIPPATLILQAGLSIGFLVLAAFAWRGRPPAIRHIIIGAVILLTLLHLATIIAQNLAQQNLTLGISSLDSILRSLSTQQLVAEFAVTLYVIWYLNRAPARAFYRGHYLLPPVPAEEHVPSS